MTGIDYTPGSAAWTQAMTASKVSAVLGYSPWESAHGLWLRMAYPDRFTDRQNKAQKRGTLLEAPLLDLWFDDHPRYRDRAGGEVRFMLEGRGYRCLATPDEDVMDGETGERVGVEHKVAARDDRREWGRAGTDEIPAHYYAQVQFQMACSGRDRTLVVRSGPFIDQQTTYEVPVDPAFRDAMWQRVDEFMGSLALGMEPGPDDRAETYHAMRTVYSRIVRDEDGEDWPVDPALAAEYTRALHGQDAAESALMLAKNRMLAVMGEARRAVVPDPRTGEVLVVATRQRKGKSVSLVRPRGTGPDPDVLQTLAEAGPDAPAAA